MKEYFISFEFRGVYGAVNFDRNMSAIIEYNIRTDSIADKAKALVIQEFPEYKNTHLDVKIIAFNNID
jgi:hypothetical protein